MFVNSLSDIDVALSQVNVLLSEVNSKLELCPAESRRNVLSRLSHILSEMMWTVSLSSEGSSESECDASSYSADVESLSWDNSEDLYRLYYDDEDEEVEDDENDDHGPIQFSDRSDEESSPHQSETNFNLNVNKETFKKKASPKMIKCAPKIGPPILVSTSDEEEDDVKED